MLTGLKVSYLRCKCVFCRPEHKQRGNPAELNFEGVELQDRNMPTYRAQRVDEKIGSFVYLSN